MVQHAAIGVRARVGVTKGNGVRSFALTRHTGIHFLLLVLIDDFRPFIDHPVECLYFVVKELIVRSEHLIIACFQRVLSAHGGGILNPVNGFAQMVGSLLRRCFIGVVRQEVLPLHDQPRKEGIEDVVLRIDEGVAQLRAKHHFLGVDEIISLAFRRRALRDHVHRPRLDSRLFELIDGVVDKGDGFGFTG